MRTQTIIVYQEGGETKMMYLHSEDADFMDMVETLKAHDCTEIEVLEIQVLNVLYSESEETQ